MSHVRLCDSLLIASLAARVVTSQAASLSPETARERLEMVGFPLGADAFVQAVATSHRPLVDLCFAGQLDVNGRDDLGRTALLLATIRQDWETCTQLLGAGADPSLADADGITPLIAAARHGRIELTRALLAAGAKPEACDADGRMPLHHALLAQKIDTFELLLPLTPRLETPCADGRDALMLAFETNIPRLALAVLERLPPNLAWTSHTRQALARALLMANHEQLRLLLSKHPAPPTPEGRRSPLLAYAIATNDATLFNLLLANGADPNTTLPSPVEKEFVPLVSGNFLRHYVEDDSGVTVLMLAAGLGRAEFVKALLATGANRGRSTAKNKMVALYFASRSPDWQCAQLLLGSGPSPDQLRLEISLTSQQAVIVKGGAPIFTTDISTGRAGFATPAGRYVITDKNRHHRSSIYKVPMPFFMRLSCRDFGLHEGAVPNYPASHGCIRVPSDAARRLFSEIPVGTLVTIN